MDALASLAKVPLFADALDEKQLAFLAKESRPAFFLAGTRLMSQGDFGGSMFVITEGKVGVTFVDADAREQSVATLGPGDVVGEMSLFTGDRRTATVAAVSNVDAIEITKWSLERVFAKAPELIDKFAVVLAKRQAELNAVSRSPAKPSNENFARQARKVFAGIFGRS
jgi:CRP/FNR family cyclic AMP-dependent transcriptional regulator